MGSWELLAEDSQIAAVHAALLPNGEVVYYSGNTGPLLPAETRVWNPSMHEVRMAPNEPETDLFCSGLTLLPDGRLLVVGGTAKYSAGPGDPWFGSRAAYLFDATQGWQRIGDMAFGRWYPSAISLPDGRVLVVSGEGGEEVGGARTQQAEIFDPFGGWQVLPPSANRFLPLYPRLHVLASGEIGCAGQGAATAILNLDTFEWREVAAAEAPLPIGGGSDPPMRPHRRRVRRRTGSEHDGHDAPAPEAHRDEDMGGEEHGRPGPMHTGHEHPPDSIGPRPDDLSVLVGPAQAMLVLNAGGGSPATTAAQVIDLGAAEPAWRPIVGMNHPRWFPNSALLPDGRPFVVGGGRLYNDDPVMEPEIFDPVAETWTPDVPMEVPRLYHSTALLLPDGRVWVAGRDGETRMELYSPDYVFAGPGPILFAAPEGVAYGQVFPIPMADAGDVANVCFIRTSTVTHAFNMTQRYVPLDFAVTGPEEIQIAAPTSPNVAPPGHYMLFIMNGAGVPAVAPIVQLVAVGPFEPVGPVEEGEDMARIAELEAQVAELRSLVGHLTGDVVQALRDTLALRRLRDMKAEVTNIADHIERHRPG
jgi:hypothetical protein